MIAWEKFQKIVNTNNKFVLTTHHNPDGDGMGSEVGLYFYLKQLGKSVQILNPSKTPRLYQFMGKGLEVHEYLPKKHKQILADSEVLIALDIGNFSRMDLLAHAVVQNRLITVSIDHHPKANDRFDYYFTDTTASSTAEIIFLLFENEPRTKITNKIAEALYVGIITDTGRFSYQATSSKTHQIAATLLSHGIEPYVMFNKIYEQNRACRIPLLVEFLSNLQYANNRQVSYSFFTNKMLKNVGADRQDTDGFIDVLRTVDGVEITIMFSEINQNSTRVNFRSRGKYPVNLIANKFGGGGHPNAAGATINEPLKQAIPVLLLEIEKTIKTHEGKS